MSGDLRATAHELEIVVGTARQILAAVVSQFGAEAIPSKIQQYTKHIADLISDSKLNPFLDQLTGLALSDSKPPASGKKKKNLPHKKLIFRVKGHIQEIQSACDRLQVLLGRLEEFPAKGLSASGTSAGVQEDELMSALRFAQIQLQRSLDLSIIGISNPTLEQATERLKTLLQPIRRQAWDNTPSSRPIDLLYESMEANYLPEMSMPSGAILDLRLIQDASFELQRIVGQLEVPRGVRILDGQLEHDRQIFEVSVRAKAVRAQLKDARKSMEAEMALMGSDPASSENARQWGIKIESCADLLNGPEWDQLRQLDIVLESLINYSGSPRQTHKEVCERINKAIEHLIRFCSQMSLPKPTDLSPAPEGTDQPGLLKLLGRARQTMKRVMLAADSRHPQSPPAELLSRLSKWLDDCFTVISLVSTPDKPDDRVGERILEKLREFEELASKLVRQCLIMNEKLRLAKRLQQTHTPHGPEPRSTLPPSPHHDLKSDKSLTFGLVARRLTELLSHYERHEEMLELAARKLHTVFESISSQYKPVLSESARQLMRSSRANRYYQEQLQRISVQITGQDPSDKLPDPADMESRLRRLEVQIERTVTAFNELNGEIELALSAMEEAFQPPDEIGRDLIPLCGSSPREAMAIIRWRKDRKAHRREAIERLRQTGQHWLADLKIRVARQVAGNSDYHYSPPLISEQLEQMLSGMKADASVDEAYRIIQNISRYESELIAESAAQAEIDFAEHNRTGWAYLTQSVRRRPYNRGINELARKAAVSRFLANYRAQRLRAVLTESPVGEFAWITPADTPPLLKIVLREKK